MDLSEHLTIYQQVALVRDAVGASVRLQPYDELLRVVISDDRCGITVRRWKVTERATETRLTQPRQVTQAWTKTPDGWKPVLMPVDGRMTDQFSLDDETVPQYLIVSHRAGKSPQEFRDQLIWDSLCSRPGAGRLGQRDYEGVQRETTKKWNRVFGSGSWEAGND